MKRSLVVIASAVGLMCLGGTPVWAGQMSTPDVQWTYNFTPSGPTSSGFVQADNPQGGSVSLTNEPTKFATNSSDVVVTNLRVSSTAPATSPDTLNTAGNYQVTLQLHDIASGTGANATDTMTFTGKLGGSFSQSNSNVTNTFTGTQSYTWTAPSGNQYTVTLVGYTPPGPPTATHAGSISAYVQVTPPVGPASVPEPSTLVLSCLGLGFAGLASWRKRRRSLAAMLA
ncbi:MAG TPA: PEP-CTERM sorting domain-containing protein [Gemmataceae bacterium]|nr:PEP-CTERM sorting domain-containing protein [Gemmataceae bacterium]